MFLNSRSISTLTSFSGSLTKLDKQKFVLASIFLLLGSFLDSSILLIVVFITQLLSHQSSSNPLNNYFIECFHDYGQQQILTLALFLVCICFFVSFVITLRVNIFSCNLVSRIASRKYAKFITMPYADKHNSDPIGIKNMFTQTTYRIMAEVVNPVFRIVSSIFNVIIISTILFFENKNTFLIVTLAVLAYILIISIFVRHTTKELSPKKRNSLDNLLKYCSFTPSMLIDISLYNQCRMQSHNNYNTSLLSYLKIDQTETLFSILPRSTLEFLIGIVALVLCFQVTNQGDFSQVILYGLAIQKLIPSVQKLQTAHLKLSLNKDIFVTFLNF